jgi:hypothetical protein
VDRKPLSMWWNQQTWDRARAAFVAELDEDPPGPNTLLGWILAAVDAHAVRTPAARLEVAGATESGGEGFSKVHVVPVQTLQLIDEALISDRQVCGRHLSWSAWLREAVSAAADQTERRRGAPRPSAPPPLPRAPQPAVCGLSVPAAEESSEKPSRRGSCGRLSAGGLTLLQ